MSGAPSGFCRRLGRSLAARLATAWGVARLWVLASLLIHLVAFERPAGNLFAALFVAFYGVTTGQFIGTGDGTGAMLAGTFGLPWVALAVWWGTRNEPAPIVAAGLLAVAWTGLLLVITAVACERRPLATVRLS